MVDAIIQLSYALNAIVLWILSLFGVWVDPLIISAVTAVITALIAWKLFKKVPLIVVILLGIVVVTQIFGFFSLV